MTKEENLDKKATAVKNTWAKRCDKHVFFSSFANDSFPTIGLGVPEGRNHLIGKSVQAFRYCYDNYGTDYDWFLKADDDTYVIVENLRFFLAHNNPDDMIYFGHKFKVLVRQGYFSGGAGYVISRKALEVLVTRGLSNPFLCRQDGSDEDVEIGRCMERLGVQAGDTLDWYDRETFHPFLPIQHLEGTHPKWLFDYSFHTPKKVTVCSLTIFIITVVICLW